MWSCEIKILILSILCVGLLSCGANQPTNPTSNVDDADAVDTPYFNPYPGISSIPQYIGILCPTAGAIIYYTTNGNIPSKASSIFSNVLYISTTCTIKAFATKAGMSDSVMVSGTFTISGTVSPPLFSPAEGTYGSLLSVSISSSTPSASIFYTTNGDVPTTLSPVYSVPINISSSATLKALATKSGWTNSSVSIANYTIMLGTVATFAGSGAGTFADGNGIAACFNVPTGLCVDSNGNIILADTWNNRIRKIASDGEVTTIAGSYGGFSDGQSTNASFFHPYDVAADNSGNIFVADFDNNCIRKISSTGYVTTVAGTNIAAYSDGPGDMAYFNHPSGIAIDNDGNIFVTDSYNNCIRKITSSNIVTTIAGSLSEGYVDGNGTGARFRQPMDIALDSNGNLFISDTWNHRIRKISISGDVTTFAGSGSQAFVDGIGTSSSFDTPFGISIDSSGYIYVADSGNKRVRKISSSGIVSAIAGSGIIGFQDGSAALAKFNGLNGIVVTGSGNIFTSDNNRVRRVIP
ncbi:MAG: chitobiase/beta-hexosaminidase C-terminal domain-containing protein [Spirochaetes bacterium]|nr:chitobiase/beta-hexosaminidase C-terminal domain-containing protein [Spirochaetota bacterium]